MSLIRFYSEKTTFRLRQIGIHRTWIENCINSHGKSPGDLTFIFSTDAHILEINRNYLNHIYFTDVISFDYSKGDMISGDVFISLDTVRKNAREYGVSVASELRRVMIHGVLHFIGYKDSTLEEKEIMRNMENEALHLW